MKKNLAQEKGAIIAVDFDGTLCKDEYPYIGEPNLSLIEHLIVLKDVYDAKIILWTCRCGEMLMNAIEWCRERGLEFDAVNENLPESIARFGCDSKKIYADYYIDDKNVDMHCFKRLKDEMTWEDEIKEIDKVIHGCAHANWFVQYNPAAEEYMFKLTKK